jgi:hypothetical protein
MEQGEKYVHPTEDEDARRVSTATTYQEGQNGLQIDHNVEKKLVLKLDLHIAPIVMILYLIAFLDRYSSSSPRKLTSDPTSATPMSKV